VDYQATIIESQPDWLTVTCTSEDKVPAFRRWARRCVAWEAAAKNRERNFAAFGYEGVACGRVRWGCRDDGDMVQLSGDVAAKELHNALDAGTNVSRIDLAVTVHLDPPDAQLEVSHYKQFLASPSREGRRTSASLVQSSDGGATFYLGKRVSDVMLRVYNKAVESGDPRYLDCHRYELEVKGDNAVFTATTLAQSSDPGEFCHSAVFDWVSHRGVTPAFTCEQPRRLQPGFRRRSDEDTKLLWLQQSVAPTVAWLRSFGDQRRVLHALGYRGGHPDQVLYEKTSPSDLGLDVGAVGDGS
jgi:DNA relaxase NicK